MKTHFTSLLNRIRVLIAARNQIFKVAPLITPLAQASRSCLFLKCTSETLAPAGDFLYTKLKAQTGVGNKYDNYMRVFYMPQGGFYIDANNTQAPGSGFSLGGFTSRSEPKNIVMLNGADLTGSVHEVYHSLKLPHTWESKNHINPIFNSQTNPQRNGKHSFREKTTRNVMDYGPHSAQYFLYDWQCVVANSNASAEPVDYIPAP